MPVIFGLGDKPLAAAIVVGVCFSRICLSAHLAMQLVIQPPRKHRAPRPPPWHEA